MKLRPAGAGYRFCQSRLNIIQQAARLHAAREQRSGGAIQTGALDERADVKIELIVRFFGNWMHLSIVRCMPIQRIEVFHKSKEADSYHKPDRFTS